MYIIYNCGYYSGMKKKGPITGKLYAFMKKFVTEVDDKDGEAFLKMTSNDIPWCEVNDRSLPPFMSLEDFCNAKPGRFTYAGLKDKKYDPNKYLEVMLLK